MCFHESDVSLSLLCVRHQDSFCVEVAISLFLLSWSSSDRKTLWGRDEEPFGATLHGAGSGAAGQGLSLDCNLRQRFGYTNFGKSREAGLLGQCHLQPWAVSHDCLGTLAVTIIIETILKCPDWFAAVCLVGDIGGTFRR